LGEMRTGGTGGPKQTLVATEEYRERRTKRTNDAGVTTAQKKIKSNLTKVTKKKEGDRHTH